MPASSRAARFEISKLALLSGTAGELHIAAREDAGTPSPKAEVLWALAGWFWSLEFEVWSFWRSASFKQTPFAAFPVIDAGVGIGHAHGDFALVVIQHFLGTG